MVMKMVGEGN